MPDEVQPIEGLNRQKTKKTDIIRSPDGTVGNPRAQQGARWNAYYLALKKA